MARIRIINGMLPGHSRCSSDSIGKRDPGPRGGTALVTEAQAIQYNMQSRVTAPSPEELFSQFMFARIAAGNDRYQTSGRVFEGFKNRLTSQVGKYTFRQSPVVPGACQIRTYGVLTYPYHESSTPSDEYAGVPSASAQLGDFWGAHQAVNGSPNQGWFTPNGSGFPQWWKYDFRLPVWVESYVISTFVYQDQTPSAWSFQGSNDDTNWTTIESRTQTGWPQGSSITFTLPAPAFYRYYRLYITDNPVHSQVIIPDISFNNATPADGSPAIWTPFSDGTPGTVFRIGCIVPVAADPPGGLGISVDGAASWQAASGMTLVETKESGKSYVGTVTLGSPASDHPVRVRSAYNDGTYYTINALAAEKVS